MSVDNRKLQKEIKKLVTIGYQIYLPNEYEKQRNGVMNETYENPDLYKWMLRHKRRSL